MPGLRGCWGWLSGSVHLLWLCCSWSDVALDGYVHGEKGVDAGVGGRRVKDSIHKPGYLSLPRKGPPTSFRCTTESEKGSSCPATQSSIQRRALAPAQRWVHRTLLYCLLGFNLRTGTWHQSTHLHKAGRAAQQRGLLLFAGPRGPAPLREQMFHWWWWQWRLRPHKPSLLPASAASSLILWFS